MYMHTLLIITLLSAHQDFFKTVTVVMIIIGDYSMINNNEIIS